MEYVLIIFMYAGILSEQDNSVALNNVNGFQTKEFCEEAGHKAMKEFKNFGFKSGKYVCVRTK